MASTLSIVLDGAHPVTLRAARELARAWVGGVRLAIEAREGPRIHLGLGSLVRPSVIVRFETPYISDETTNALALGVVAWDSLDALEPWRALSAPLAGIPHYGSPRRMPWAVTLARDATHDAHQLHVLGGFRPPRRGAVWWPSSPRAVAAVLGRAACVLGENDPLVFDAHRAGVPVYPNRDAPNMLAGLVPPSLLGEPSLWQHVAETARDVHATGRAPAPLLTPAWIAIGRDRIRSASPSAWQSLRRRHDKLRRDPKRFFADSRFSLLRAVGKIIP